MERRANYLLVGAFTLGLIVAGIAFVLWANKHGDKEKLTPYLIYFERAVNGLSKGSAVRFLGVDVGQVENISLDTQPSLRVRVLVSIRENVPLTTSTIASLKPNGLTGLYFIDLRPGDGGTPLGKSGSDYPVIASEESALDKLVSGAPGVLEQVQGLLVRTEKLLSDENITSFSASVRNVEQFTGTLAANNEHIASTMRDLANVSASLAAATKALEKGTKDVNIAEMVQSLNATAKSLRAITERIDALTASQAGNVGQGLGELRQTIAETRRAMRDIGSLARKLDERPSSLLLPEREQGVAVPP